MVSYYSHLIVADDPFLRIFVDYFNLLVGRSENARVYWENEVAESLKHTFFYLATEG